MENKRVHAVVKGRVQGVGFRYFVIETATSLGLNGWVRNRWDGNVELIAEGEKEDLERLITALRIGPRMAHVSDVACDWEEPRDEFSGFNVRSTV
jgi:acylphosphatase